MAEERPLSARAPASGGDRDPAATPAERRPSKARRMSAGAITDLGDGVRSKGRRLSANLGESLQEFARMTQVQQSGYKDPMVASIAEQIRRYDKSMVHKSRASLSQRIAIDPRTSAWIGWWDGVISIALLFTAIVTPVEVGFMSIPEDRWQDPLFLTNRGVDVIFILDLLLQFVLMYPATGSVAGVTTHGSSNMVDDLRLIAKNYLFSWWFALDFFSIGVSGFDIFSPEDSGTSRLTALRAVRALRLFKLIRLARGSRIFKRWEMRLSINYAVLSIAQICVMLCFVCHLFACLWGLQASFDPLGTWLGAKGYCVPFDPATEVCQVGFRCDALEGWECAPAGTTYLYSLYWSIATVTSIGYGDVVATPLKLEEQIICVTMMLFGSLLFAYLVGSFCGVAANLSPEVVRFRQDLTDLNKFLTANSIPSGLRYQLREYMHQTVYLRRNATGNRLLSDLAPKLRNEVALTINEKWLHKIDLLNDECEEGLILELAFVLRLMIFPPGDSCPVGQIYIVSRGAALFQGRAYTVGTTWGEGDALLTSERLRFPIPASALSYLFTYGIDGDVLRATMSQTKYPEAAARMRHKQVIWIVRRGIVRAAEDKLALHNLKFKKQRGSLMGGIARAAVQAARQGRRLQRENTGERLQQGGRPARDKRHSHEDMGRRTRVPSHERFDSNVVSMARGDFGSSSYGSPAGGGKVDSASFKKTQDALSLLQRDVDELKRSHFEDARAIREMLGILIKQALGSKAAGRSSFVIAHEDPDELRRSLAEYDKTLERESNSSTAPWSTLAA